MFTNVSMKHSSGSGRSSRRYGRGFMTRRRRLVERSKAARRREATARELAELSEKK